MKNQKISLLQMALKASQKNLAEQKAKAERYAKSKRIELKNKKVQKLNDGSYLIPDNMSGKSFEKFLNQTS